MNTIKTGICPVCNGSKRMSAASIAYKSGYRGYDADSDTLPCNNCGGQTMWGEPSGVVSLRDDDTPCVHEYDCRKKGRCYHVYYCKHCSYSFDIDSGD